MDGEIVGLSADGSVVVGVTSDLTQTFRWKMNEPVRLLTIPDSSRVEARDDRQSISANGDIIVGEVELNSGVLRDRVFRWDATADSFSLLPSGAASEIEAITGTTGTFLVTPEEGPSVSADGDTIVGTGIAVEVSLSTVVLDWAFQWTNSNGTSDSPQISFSERFTPHSVSGDSSTVIGQFTTQLPTTPVLPPFSVRKKNFVGETILSTFSAPLAVSHDGETIAGKRLGSGLEGYRWTPTIPLLLMPVAFLP